MAGRAAHAALHRGCSAGLRDRCSLTKVSSGAVFPCGWACRTGDRWPETSCRTSRPPSRLPRARRCRDLRSGGAGGTSAHRRTRCAASSRLEPDSQSCQHAERQPRQDVSAQQRSRNRPGRRIHGIQGLGEIGAFRHGVLPPGWPAVRRGNSALTTPLGPGKFRRAAPETNHRGWRYCVGSQSVRGRLPCRTFNRKCSVLKQHDSRRASAQPGSSAAPLANHARRRIAWSPRGAVAMLGGGLVLVALALFGAGLRPMACHRSRSRAGDRELVGTAGRARRPRVRRQQPRRGPGDHAGGHHDWNELAQSREAYRHLLRVRGAFEYISAVWLADEAGMPRLTTRGFPAPPLSVADREHFQVQRGADAGPSSAAFCEAV